MKKFLSLFLFTILAITLFAGCSVPVIYPEEELARQWLLSRTAGYELLDAKIASLYRDEAGFKLYLSTSSYDNSPFLEVEYDPTNMKIREKNIVTVCIDGQPFNGVYNTTSVFDPYTNSEHSSMQVYKKDEKTYRVFFWFAFANTDFFPIPKLLTETQYQTMLAIVNEENEKAAAKSETEGTEPLNYTGAFLDMYKPTYTSSLASNPDGILFYEYTPLSQEALEKHNGGEADFRIAFRGWFNKMNLSAQDWRSSFESLGYKEYNPLYQIFYVDISVGTSVTDLTLNISDGYLSPALKELNLALSYDFCPSLREQDCINATQK